MKKMLPLLGLVGLASPAYAQLPNFTLATYPVGAVGSPSKVTVADVNADGKPDLVMVSGGGGKAGVLLGRGDGTFQPVSAYATGVDTYSSSVAVADVNNDGKADLLTANSQTRAVGVLLGNGNGTFQPVVAYATGGTVPYGTGGGPTDLAVADLNGDGKPDVVTTNGGSDTAGVLLGNGDGSFRPAVLYPTGSASYPTIIKLADLNNDGVKDVVTANQQSSTVGVLLGRGDGTFQSIVTFTLGPAPPYLSNLPYGLAVADVNADGNADLLTTGATTGRVSVLLGTGTGSFQPAATYLVNWLGVYSAYRVLYGTAAADLDGDGKVDLLTACGEGGAVYVLPGKGDGSFGEASRCATGDKPGALTTADVNGDGRPDIIATNYGNSTLAVLLNTVPLASRAALPEVSISLAPNPAAEAGATLALGGLPATVAQVQATLLDATGRAVRQYTLAAGQGRARAEVPTTALASGLYLLRLAPLDALGTPAGSLTTQRLSVR